MFPTLHTIRERLTLRSWQSTQVAGSTQPPASHAASPYPPERDRLHSLGDIPQRHQRQDFRTPDAAAGRSFSAVLEWVQSQGPQGKSAWTDLAVNTCQRCGREDRARLLLVMASNGFTPTEAAAAHLYFSGRHLAQALVRMAQEGNEPWKRYLVYEIRTGIHYLHRGNGHRELTAALARGDAPAAAALRAAGFRYEAEPWSAYFQTAHSGDPRVLQAAIAADVRFDRRHQAYAEIAAARGDLAFVTLLHENGMPLDQAVPVNRMLWNGVESGRRDLVDYLLTRGARGNLQDIAEGRPATLMELALSRRDMPMADLLIRHGYQLHGQERAAYFDQNLAGSSSRYRNIGN